MQTQGPKNMSECQDPRCVSRNKFNDTCATLGGALLVAFTLALAVSYARGQTHASLVHSVLLIAGVIVAIVLLFSTILGDRNHKRHSLPRS